MLMAVDKRHMAEPNVNNKGLNLMLMAADK